MARQPRLAIAGFAHHVIVRGHNGGAVALDETDRLTLLVALREAARTHGTQVNAYRIQRNEVQFLLTPATAEGLSQTLQGVGRRHAAAFNRRHGRTGALWDGRFRAAPIEPGPFRLSSLRSIDASASSPEAGEGDLACATSSEHRLGGRRDDLLVDPPEYWQLGNTPFERELAYRSLLSEGLPPEVEQRLRQAVMSGRPFGSDRFVAEVGQLVGRPVSVRPRGRPRRSTAEVGR